MLYIVTKLTDNKKIRLEFMFLHDNLTDSPHIFVFIGPAFPKVGLFFA